MYHVHNYHTYTQPSTKREDLVAISGATMTGTSVVSPLPLNAQERINKLPQRQKACRPISVSAFYPNLANMLLLITGQENLAS